MTMTKWIAALALLTAGCSNECDDLKKKLCEGQDDATCKAMKEWFDSDFLKGPDGKKMSSDEASLGCKMIMADKEALTNAIEAAKRKIEKK
jgi:hypothetical protein